MTKHEVDKRGGIFLSKRDRVVHDSYYSMKKKQHLRSQEESGAESLEDDVGFNLRHNKELPYFGWRESQFG